MRTFKVAAILIAAMMLSGTNQTMAAEQIECAPVVAGPAPEAFASYCGRCHKAEVLSDEYFAGVSEELALQREAELALFLDRHSACPHQHHEEIAAWLREMAMER
ncbi:MAG: hypothetical protein KDJ62_01425 [Rhodobiaceae bacterium]|nr:hypothetical protein [Rhodobiaceae bacterium]MCC0047918.1 hypothetical protein [Rhodobiaceae bacterium]